MQIAQLSDSHISLSHPQRVTDLKATIACINAAAAECVIHSGDITHDALAEEYTIARNVLAELQAPLLPMVGNRDNRTSVIETFSDSPYIHTDMPYVQYSVEHLPVRIIILDTLHESSNKGQMCPVRMAHFERMLAWDTDKPIAIFMHHPPFEAHEIPEPRQFEDWSQVEEFTRIVSRFPTIRGIWCGHVHRNIESSAGAVPASAMTCLACDLRKGNLTDSQRTQPVYKILSLP